MYTRVMNSLIRMKIQQKSVLISRHCIDWILHECVELRRKKKVMNEWVMVAEHTQSYPNEMVLWTCRCRNCSSAHILWHFLPFVTIFPETRQLFVRNVIQVCSFFSEISQQLNGKMLEIARKMPVLKHFMTLSKHFYAHHEYNLSRTCPIARSLGRNVKWKRDNNVLKTREIRHKNLKKR